MKGDGQALALASRRAAFHTQEMSHSRHRTFFRQQASAPERRCDMPGCRMAGEFRAPKSRTALRDYYWFCLEHVRSYNAAWDYYAGMKPEEIEREIRRNVTWDRPTWPLGKGPSGPGKSSWAHRYGFDMRNEFEFYKAEASACHRRGAPNSMEEHALSVLDLTYPITLEDLKNRYKQLVKKHHPDTNGGTKAAEEKIKLINHAYRTLRDALTS